MYKEKVVPSKKSNILVVTIIIIAMIGAYIFDWLITFFNLPYRSFLQLSILIVLGVCIYILIRNVLSEYEYTLTDDEFIITSSLGGNEKPVVTVKLENIIFIARYDNEQVKTFSTNGVYNAKKSLSPENLYACIFKNGSDTYKLIIEPSKKFLDTLNKHNIEIK